MQSGFPVAALRVVVTGPIFTKFDGKVTHGLHKKPLYFDGNHIRVTVVATAILHVERCVTSRLFNNNNFATSTA